MERNGFPVESYTEDSSHRNGTNSDENDVADFSMVFDDVVELFAVVVVRHGLTLSFPFVHPDLYCYRTYTLTDKMKLSILASLVASAAAFVQPQSATVRVMFFDRG
jgi:hypothetical protein